MERLGPEAFDGTRLRRSGTWAVAFLADWCPFCRAFAPQFESLGPLEGVQLGVADLTDEENPLWERFDVEVVPTVAVFREGALTYRRNGRFARGLRRADLDAIRTSLTSK